MTDLRTALAGLLEHVDNNTCTHESLNRGGAIWTICDDCGKKWADDEGGFKPHKDAPAVATARAALSSSQQPVGGDVVARHIRMLRSALSGLVSVAENEPGAMLDGSELCDSLADARLALASTPAASGALAQGEAVAWMPISTAPKDNTVIRLYAQGGGFHDEDFNPSGSVEGFWCDGEWCGAFWDGQHDTWFRRDGIVPTHWMPLPHPPSPASGEKG